TRNHMPSALESLAALIQDAVLVQCFVNFCTFLWLFSSSFRGAKQLICGLEDNAAETNRIILLHIQKCPNRLGGGTSVMSAERGIHPVFGKENIAGALNFAKQFQ